MNYDQRRASEESDTPTRGKLIKATQLLVASEGAERLTSRTIAAAADVNLASITYYFGSKEQLMTEAMIATARDLLAPVVATLRSTGEPIAKMMESVTLLNQILNEHHEDLIAYLQAIAWSPSNPSIASALQSLHRDMTELIAQQIDIQQSVEQLPAWISPTAMAQLIVAVVHGTLVTSVVDSQHTDQAAIGAQFARLLLEARTTSVD